MPYTELAAGIYFVGFAALMNTDNLLSGVLFRVLPAIFGTLILFDALARLGLLQ